MNTTQKVLSQNINQEDFEIPQSAFDWSSVDTDIVEVRLKTNSESGLSSSEVGRRQMRFGANEIKETGQSSWISLLTRQFMDALIWILICAAALSASIGEITDALAILIIVILNGILGFVQEWKAERAVEALKKMFSPSCRVIRNGTEVTIDAATLVPGDIVSIKAGDRIPADLRVLESMNLRVDESALTGESESVVKQKETIEENSSLAEMSSMTWMGTSVTNGHGLGIVVAIGESTQFGQIATLTSSIETDRTPLQKKLAVLGGKLGISAIGLSLLVIVTGLLMAKPFLEMFMTGVSLAVAVVPEGMPAVVTITLALGIRVMVKRKALLRRLQAAEALGEATIICTDKTGTLTQNQMTVQQIWLPSDTTINLTGVGYDPEGHFEVNNQKIDHQNDEALMSLLKSGMRCNHARIEQGPSGWKHAGEPTELALIVAAHKAQLFPNSANETVDEFSFSSERKRMTVVDESCGCLTAHVKGAPEVILERCKSIGAGSSKTELSEIDKTRLIAVCNDMSDQGLRVLAIARRSLDSQSSLNPDEVEVDLSLLGLVGILDPPRPEVREAISKAKTAGIDVVMMTGDSSRTALAIANRVGLESSVAIEGKSLGQMSDDELRTALSDKAVFARMIPEHKLRIVKLLQQDGHVVGMTGDGVNDAPALKRADIGIAMGFRGTDVAKGASDIVLTDDNFSSIINAVEEGRRQYDNIQKFVRYMLSCNAGEAVAIFLNIVIGGPLILLPVQILWMNLITDSLTALALGLESAEEDIMERPPRNPASPILDRTALAMVVGLGTYVGLITLWLFQSTIESGNEASILLAQTMAFNGIIVIEWFNVINFRTLRMPVLKVGLFTNKWMLVAIVFTIFLQLCAIYSPILQPVLHTTALSWSHWGITILVSLPVLAICELMKWGYLFSSNHKSKKPL